MQDWNLEVDSSLSEPSFTHPPEMIGDCWENKPVGEFSLVEDVEGKAQGTTGHLPGEADFPSEESSGYEDDCYLTATQILEDFLQLTFACVEKKSVTFAADTIFVERNMESPFWKEMAERKKRRKAWKEQRRLRAQARPITLFDLLKSTFTKKNQFLVRRNPEAVKVLRAEKDLNNPNDNESKQPTSSSDTEDEGKNRNSRIYKIFQSLHFWMNGNGSRNESTSHLQNHTMI